MECPKIDSPVPSLTPEMKEYKKYSNTIAVPNSLFLLSEANLNNRSFRTKSVTKNEHRVREVVSFV